MAQSVVTACNGKEGIRNGANASCSLGLLLPTQDGVLRGSRPNLMAQARAARDVLFRLKVIDRNESTLPKTDLSKLFSVMACKSLVCSLIIEQLSKVAQPSSGKVSS